MSILLEKLLNIRPKIEQLLPAQPCFLCHAASRNGILCAACDSGLPYLTEPHCPICALPTARGDICGRCLQNTPEFDHTLAVFSYEFPLDKLVHAVKFAAYLILIENLAVKMTQHIEHQPDCIIPMPLHPARLRQRGFNQSLELARQIGKRMDIPVLCDASQRVRDTPPQSSLNWNQRSKNMHRAFTCTQDLSGKHVAVVDDVMTSGASLNELGRTLRQAGARKVSAWVIARTLPR